MDIKKEIKKIDEIQFTVFSIDENDLHFSDAGDLKKAINYEITKGNINLAIDLNSFNTISSSGLGILIGCLKIVNSANGKLKLLNVNEKIFNIFKITKLHQIFEL